MNQAAHTSARGQLFPILPIMESRNFTTLRILSSDVGHILYEGSWVQMHNDNEVPLSATQDLGARALIRFSANTVRVIGSTRPYNETSDVEAPLTYFCIIDRNEEQSEISVFSPPIDLDPGKWHDNIILYTFSPADTVESYTLLMATQSAGGSVPISHIEFEALGEPRVFRVPGDKESFLSRDPNLPLLVSKSSPVHLIPSRPVEITSSLLHDGLVPTYTPSIAISSSSLLPREPNRSTSLAMGTRTLILVSLAPAPSTDSGQGDPKNLMGVVIGVCTALGVFIAALAIFCIVRARRRKGRSLLGYNRDPHNISLRPYILSQTQSEELWTPVDSWATQLAYIEKVPQVEGDIDVIHPPRPESSLGQYSEHDPPDYRSVIGNHSDSSFSGR